MKKTIAILLILVIGMVGVWADTDTATLAISSTVPAYNAIKITTEAYSFADPFSYAGFYDGTDEVVTSLVPIISTNYTAKVTVGYFNYFTNDLTGFSTTVSATPLIDEIDENVTTKIGYSVYLTFDETSTEVVTVSKNAETAVSGSQFALPVNTNTVTTGSSPIEVKVVDNDFQTALASDGYTANITFTYTTT